MGFGSKLAKSTNSPQMVWSLICGYTGDDDRLEIGCISTGTEVDITGCLAVGCLRMDTEVVIKG